MRRHAPRFVGKSCAVVVLTFVSALLADRADAQSTGQITGTVTSEAGQPLAGVTVVLSDQRKVLVGVNTDAGGGYTFSNLAPAT